MKKAEKCLQPVTVNGMNRNLKRSTRPAPLVTALFVAYVTNGKKRPAASDLMTATKNILQTNQKSI